MKRNTKSLGDRSEAIVLAELIQACYKVWIPFGEDQRYDLILDDAGALSRVQVKTGRLRDGAILFQLLRRPHGPQRAPENVSRRNRVLRRLLSGRRRRLPNPSWGSAEHLPRVHPRYRF